MLVISLGTFLSVLLTLLFYNLLFLGKIYPGVSIAGVPVSSFTPEKAYETLSENIEQPDKIALLKDGSSFEIELSTINFSYELSSSIERAYKLDRSGKLINDFYNRIFSLKRKENFPLNVSFDQERLLEHLSIISDEISVEPAYPRAMLVEGKVFVEKGSPGLEMDIETLSKEIINNLSYANYSPVSIRQKIIDPTISDQEAKSLKERAESLIDKKLSLDTNELVFESEGDDLFKLLEPSGGYSSREIEALVSDIASRVNRPPQDAAFVFLPAGRTGESSESGKVTEFSAPKDGLEVDEDTLGTQIVESLTKLEEVGQNLVAIEVPLSTTSPEITLDAINELGVNELLGRGTSKFSGSIASRIFNIGHASSKFNGVLIPPGEIFSFNEILGDVSSYTGYKKAYIIKDGRTVLGDGGGVCQVSTTLFRAILNSGLPVVERRAHSYRVSYYEQDSLPGLDATVYAPYTDLKVKNDTPGHLLIQTRFDQTAATLAFEIYGTSDGRKVKLTKPVITSTSAPPEDLYIDDPTLASGTVKQIDFKAWGANVYFDYEVTRDGETIFEKTFYSNFRPWQAVYLRGTGPVN
ncbi:MAG: VanW family protein [Patescibacteria group bacterium]